MNLERNEGKTPKEIMTYETNEIYRTMNSTYNSNAGAITAMQDAATTVDALEQFAKVLPTIIYFLKTKNLLLSMQDASVNMNDMQGSITAIMGADAAKCLTNINASANVFNTLESQFNAALIADIKASCNTLKLAIEAELPALDKI